MTENILSYLLNSNVKLSLTKLKFELYGNEARKAVMKKKPEPKPVEVKPEPPKVPAPALDDKNKPKPAQTPAPAANQPPKAKKSQPAAKEKDKDCRLI